jgi:DeoR/GlpR family transcriptional regulator of sugar metabolism
VTLQPPILSSERRDRILDVLDRHGAVKLSTLHETLGFSEATLRRDLQQLESEGLLRRTYGGAMRLKPETALELSVHDKAAICAAEKQAIGRAAAGLVAPGDVIALNGGTTTVQVARALRQMPRLRLVTNSIGVATELAAQPNVEVTVTGGTLRGSLELYGPQAEQTLQQLYVHTAFLGVDGLTIRQGLTTYNPLEAHTNQAIIARAERVVVVADHTKIGRVTLAVIAPCSAIHVLITDSAAPASEIDALTNAGIEVLIAG